MKRIFPNKLIYFNLVYNYKGYDSDADKIILERNGRKIRVPRKDKNLKKYTEEK